MAYFEEGFLLRICRGRLQLSKETFWDQIGVDLVGQKCDFLRTPNSSSNRKPFIFCFIILLGFLVLFQ